MPYRRATAAWSHLNAKEGTYALLNGDCVDLLRALPDESISLVATSPPYCMGKEYEAGNTIDDFILAHDEILPEILRVLKPGGSICWQVGYHVDSNQVMPLDYLVMDAMRKLADPPSYAIESSGLSVMVTIASAGLAAGTRQFFGTPRAEAIRLILTRYVYLSSIPVRLRTRGR